MEGKSGEAEADFPFLLEISAIDDGGRHVTPKLRAARYGGGRDKERRMAPAFEIGEGKRAKCHGFDVGGEKEKAAMP